MKSGEKALYSRGTPAEIYKELSENDEVGTYFDYVTKYVLWDDVLDWEREIDCSLPGSSIHGIFQARVLEWGAIAFSEVGDSCTLFNGWQHWFNELI